MHLSLLQQFTNYTSQQCTYVSHMEYLDSGDFGAVSVMLSVLAVFGLGA